MSLRQVIHAYAVSGKDPPLTEEQKANLRALDRLLDAAIDEDAPEIVGHGPAKAVHWGREFQSGSLDSNDLNPTNQDALDLYEMLAENNEYVHGVGNDHLLPALTTYLSKKGLIKPSD